MPPNPLPTERSSGKLQRSTRGGKEVFGLQVQVPASRMLPPQVKTKAQPLPGAPSLHSIPTQQRPLQPPAQSRQSARLTQPSPSVGRPAPTASPAVTQSVQPSNVGPKLAHIAKKARKDAWTGLKVALKLLERTSDVFPPLKSAVAGFLGTAAAQNREDYAELASNLQTMVCEFAAHPGEQTSSRMLEALNDMTGCLQKEIAHVQKQQQRSGFRRHLEVGQDSDDVQQCHDRVEKLRRALQDKAMLRMWRIGEEQQVDARLETLNAALKAMYNSSMSTVIGRRKCTPGTRETILAGMRKWANNLSGPKVYWLNGMAGTGKTTLAYSFCAEMQQAGRLGASFFCSRVDADSRDVSRIVPTIAHQLARLLPSYREALIRQIGKDKDIGARNMETQFEKLIRDPLLEIKTSVSEGIVVTIDALDECDERNGAQEILDILFLHARYLPIKFFITCRPEPGLFDTLQSKDERYRSVLHLHDIEASFVKADITTFLEAELASLALPRDKLNRLAEQAGTLFIYAATVVRYIHPKGRPVNFHRRLEDVLSVASDTNTNRHDAINNLYTAVLAAPLNDGFLNVREKENIRLVLDTAVCAKEPMSVKTMTNFLGLEDEQDTLYALQHLRSVLHVSQGADVISTFHASFPDFMLSHERSRNLCCDAAVHNRYLTLRCFTTMQCLLRFNICNLDSSFVLDENIPDLAERTNKAISPELFYSCRYWGDHLGLADVLDDVYSGLVGFLTNYLLFWMEVMNLRNCISLGAYILTQAHAWLEKSGGETNVLELALDAGRFVTAFEMSSASRSTPHIYISTLPFWPESRPVRQNYWKHTQGLMRLEGPAMERRELSCLATWNNVSTVRCLASSPDGTRIVSGSADKIVRVWNVRSGLLAVGLSKGHTEPISSVAFSPDGSRIISSAVGGVVHVWDVRSGRHVLGPLKGGSGSVGFSHDGTRIISRDPHGDYIWDARSGNPEDQRFKGYALSFQSRNQMASPDGTRIVSCSRDHTIQICDAQSGRLVSGPFKGHTDGVNAMLFMPGGTRVVSGSRDGTIRIWDAHSGPLQSRSFEGHADSVNSVAFSLHGTRVVSGSRDGTIRVWDARSGDLVAGPFEGQTRSVNSVAFSPHSTRIVSGSSDGTVCVWDARTGLLVAGPFKGHNGSVNSVAFSPKGTRIVSGSADNTICVWDAHSGHLVAGPLGGHTKPVTSVGFSPDNTRIVSGSSDATIRVWDARTGLLVSGPFGGQTWVSTIAFSPDSTRIVSGSSDRTIRVWDAHSGRLAAGPFKGHTRLVTSVAFSPDGTLIVSGSEDKTIRVWDARTGDLVAKLEGHAKSVNCVSFSSDGIHIVSGSTDRAIRVWAPVHTRDSGKFADWEMDKGGMVTTQRGEFLLCVPLDLWTGLINPQTTVCIYREGALQLDFNRTLLGNKWKKCFRPQ